MRTIPAVGRSIYSLTLGEGANEQNYTYATEGGDGLVHELNDLNDVESLGRLEGTTLAWDGTQYVTADFPPEGRQGPDGKQGPEGIQGPEGEKGPVGEKGETGNKGPSGDVGSSIPVGGILMWSGAEEEIPDGYLLCDGRKRYP